MDPAALVSAFRAEFSRRADRRRAAETRAYLKTDQPMFGVPKPEQNALSKRLLKEHRASSRAEWEAAILGAWAGPERELRYAAIAVLRSDRGRWLTPEAVPLVERLVAEGAWWDLVDEIAVHAVGEMVAGHREAMRPVLERWIDSEELWLRRTAILAQVRHRERTDVPMLLDLCRRQAGDRSFWIRKAIGWALREHAHTDPEAVRGFLAEMGDRLSPLSRAEAGKHL